MPSTKGLQLWVNRNNGFTCARLHYSADPKKRSEEWKRRAMYGMETKMWNCEMELSWENFAGEAVYGKEFSVETHVAAKRFEPDPDNPMLVRGWDFGGNHSCVVAQLIKGRIFVLDEFANMGYNTKRIVGDVIDECYKKYGPGFRYTEIIDPSGMWEGQSSLGMACAAVMQNDPNESDPIQRGYGLTVVPGEQEPTKRINAVMSYLTSLKDAKPCLVMNPGLNMLTSGFLGGYHYPEKETQNQKKNKPVKNEYSHIHDALQYICTRITEIGDMEMYLNSESMTQPGPAYGF